MVYTHAIISKRYIFYVVSILDICIKQQIVLGYETNLACTWTSNVLIKGIQGFLRD